MSEINIGDYVICRPTGVSGTVVKQYFPTACEQQTMIQCDDGRRYHAPTRLFEKVDSPAELDELKKR